MIMAKDSHGNYVEIEDIKQQDSFKGISPINFKSNGDNLKNYRIYGNTVNGEGVGDRTANLFDGEWTQGSVNNTGNLSNENQKRIKTIVSVIPSQTYTIRTNLSIRMIFAYNDTTEESGIVSKLLDIMNGVEFATITIPDNANLIAVALMSSDNSNITPSDVEWTMLNTGSTALPYEPYGYKVPVTVTNGTDTQTTNIYLPEQIKMIGNETEYIDFGEQKQYFADGTSADVTLPAIPTLSGTNTLSVNTNIKPSKVWGGLNDPRDILYVKDKLGNILFSKYYEIEDEPPLIYRAKKAGTLKDYRIYGNTVDGESVGDRTGNLFDKDNMGNGIMNSYISSDGTTVPNQSQWIVTQYIPCNSNVITIKFDTGIGNHPSICLYDDNKNYIKGAKYQNSATITVTTEYAAKYIRFSYTRLTDLSKIMLNSGSTALPYEPYGYKVPVTVEGKNLLKNIATSQIINGITFTINDDKSITVFGELTDTNATFVIANSSDIPGRFDHNSAIIPKDLTIISTTTNNSISLRAQYTDDTYKGIMTNGVPFTIPKDIGMVYIQVTESLPESVTIYPMIRKADITDDTYEPYHAPVTTPIYLPEQIRKVGDEAEYIDYGEQMEHRLRKNLLQNTATSQTINGVTFTVNDDGSVTCNGTSDAVIQYNINTASLFNITENVILSGCPSSGASSTFLLRVIYPFDNTTSNDNGNGVLIDRIGEQTRVQIRIASGYTCNNLTFYPMIRKASIEDGTYEPYIEDTNVDVTLPAISTLTGTNTLTVGTEVQPSDIYLKGKIEKKPKIYYYSQDGQTLLYTESVLKGGNGMYSGTPTKMADPQYTYTFVGWSSSTGQTAATPEVRNNIQNNKNVYAAFSQTLNTYTVYFYNESDTPIETVQNVPYGGTATYTGATPTKQGYSFTGWSPLPTNITADTSCYAQFEEDDMYESITDTWSQIIANVSNGTYSTKYHIGDTKKIDLGTEGEVIMTIVGIDADDLADNSGKAPITWISKQLLKTDHRMNPSYQSGTEGAGSLGGWEKTEMRSYLKETVKPLIPETVRNAIKPVKKYSRIYNVSEAVVNDVVTTDDVWIPSYKEVFGTGRETQGPTYSTAFPDNASRIKSKAGSSATWWWLRSASHVNAFYSVYTDGSHNHYRAFNSYGVALGFCLGAPTYTVTYYSQDGQTVLSTETVEEGHDCTYSTVPTKESDTDFDHTFTGWSTSTNSTTATTGATENIQQNTNLYAAFSKSFKTDTISDSWEEIIANCDNGTYASKYQIGDLKTIDVGTEGPVQMQIVAIDTDLLASDNTKKAPITWISKQLLKTDRRMNPSYSPGTEGTGTIGGWEKTEMRSYLKETVKPLIPETVRNAIKPVKKYSRIYNASESAINDVLTTEDVWIPSYKELFGSGLETLGPTYSTAFPDPPDYAPRIKRKAGDSAAWWWLRSVQNRRSFMIVYADGSYYSSVADITGGVALGFCT